MSGRIEPGAPSPASGLLSDAYRTVWRWHFYAGLLVLPVLMLMALTGALYLFKGEIDDAVYRPMAAVAPSTAHAPPDEWRAAAETAGGGRATTVLLPERSDRAVRVGITREDGQKRTVFVDPATARVTGVTGFGGVMEPVKRLHSLVLFGSWANVVVEIVAGWAIILVATGVFLWWPRGRAVGVVALSTTDTARRPFWRDLHAVTGLYAGGVILFLAVTGMPWSVVWGEQVGDWVKSSGLGRPPAPVAASPWAHAAHPADAPSGTGWTMEGMVMAADHPAPARLSTVIAAAEHEGLARPYQISIPADPTLAFTASRQVSHVEDTRSLYIDGATGAVKADIGYAAFGPGAKAIEWGIAAHQGTQYGQINRFVMLGGCLAIWLLGISAVVMWWKRRPKGRLAAPVAPPSPRAKAAVLAIVLPLAILYPLTGLSLIVAVGLDRLVWFLNRPRSLAS
ncbi:PepSY domain-containing protein [Brevundimonas sp. NIBR11]|uniref:PepSY-associated TM helix domain-containing protein n=1 Tax=Brevundimonas sp. NIBR11 TaxID=3015999 RepID=UPI0022F053B5|nr:PepSY domain-containing protein [Brevundimonas sp. NIBR11]WGM30377.1 hypothetical protein KKHFBJBL_00600 [Brevundimonas sp. NIBR11]